METPAITDFSLDMELYYNISSNESVIQNKQTTPPKSTQYSAAQYWHQETPQCVPPPPPPHNKKKKFFLFFLNGFHFFLKKTNKTTQKYPKPSRPALAPGSPTGGAPPPPQTHRILKSFVCSIRLDSISLTEGSILDPCYKILE